MNKIRNKVQLIGNVGSKPILKKLKTDMYIQKYHLLQMSLNMMVTVRKFSIHCGIKLSPGINLPKK